MTAARTVNFFTAAVSYARQIHGEVEYESGSHDSFVVFRMENAVLSFLPEMASEVGQLREVTKSVLRLLRFRNYRSGPAFYRLAQAQQS